MSALLLGCPEHYQHAAWGGRAQSVMWVLSPCFTRWETVGSGTIAVVLRLRCTPVPVVGGLLGVGNRIPNWGFPSQCSGARQEGEGRAPQGWNPLWFQVSAKYTEELGGRPSSGVLGTIAF